MRRPCSPACWFHWCFRTLATEPADTSEASSWGLSSGTCSNCSEIWRDMNQIYKKENKKWARKLEQPPEEHYKTTAYQLTCCFSLWISASSSYLDIEKGSWRKSLALTLDTWPVVKRNDAQSVSVAARKIVRISWSTRQLLPLFFLSSYQNFRKIPSTLWNSCQMVKQHCCSPWSKALFSGIAFAILWESLSRRVKMRTKWKERAWRPVNEQIFRSMLT